MGGMTYLSHRAGFPMASSLVCMDTPWTLAMVDHDINYQVVMIHHTTMLHCLSTLSEY